MNIRFRFLDLLATLGAAVLLLTLTIMARHVAQERVAVTECADHLRRIGQALLNYQEVNQGQFPRTTYDPAKPLVAYTGASAADPFSGQGPVANDTTASMFLLVRRGDLPPEVMICAGALRHGLAEKDSRPADELARSSNFTARLHDNYSLANMYPDAAAVAAGYSLDYFHQKLPPQFVIAGDTNPGAEEASRATTRMTRQDMRQSNSPNHQRDGQNLLAADGSVNFYMSPLLGVGFDNVYASAKLYPNPASPTDTVLVPAWTDGPNTLPASVLTRRYVVLVAMGATLLILTWLVWSGVKRAKARDAAATRAFG